MFLRTVVLPALAGDRISPRWPLPTGAMRLMRRCEVLRVGLEVEHLVREDRYQRIEVRSPTGKLGIDPVHGVDPGEAPVPLLVLGGRLWPTTRSPVRSPNRRTMLDET